MSLTINALINNDIYLETKGSLAKRIDFAWSVYCQEKVYAEAQRKSALQFLIYAFDINDDNNINDLLINLMRDREQHKAGNPDYVPGKSPILPFNPGHVVPEQTEKHGKSHTPEITKAIREHELLDVNNKSKSKDKDKSTHLFTADERLKYQVHIRNGVFVKNNKVFSTTGMKSHNKSGYASYTLNTNGELHVFTHKGMKDKIAHSSMNAGVPIVAAGELKITRGKLTMITTHSGHYVPTLFNVYRLLEHLVNHGVAIWNTQITTFDDPADTLFGVNSVASYGSDYYIIPAIQIYRKLDNSLKENLLLINQIVSSYREGDFVTWFFNVKDKITGSTLTQERILLAEGFQKKLLDFKESLASTLSFAELYAKTIELEVIIAKYRVLNETLSKKANKNENSGRLAASIGIFAEQLRNIKALALAPEQIERMKSIY